MLTRTRKNMLLDRLSRDGQLEVSALAIEFGLSEDTMRRDIRDLASEGRLVRVHGGAIASSPTHQPLAVRRGLKSAEKTPLARRGADLICDGLTIIIDGGTTHQGLADHVPLTRRCTIVTHSPAVAASFEFHQAIEIVLVGGRLFRHSMVALGPETTLAFNRLKADLLMLGVTGLHADIGLTTGDSDEASLKRVMLAAAGETVVLATSDKLGRASPWVIAPMETISSVMSVGSRPDWLRDSVGHIDASER